MAEKREREAEAKRFEEEKKRLEAEQKKLEEARIYHRQLMKMWADKQKRTSRS